MKVRISSIIFSVCLYLSFHFLLILDNDLELFFKIPFVILGAAVSILTGYLINKLWNKWPYWLKSGVITGGIAIISVTSASLCEYLIPVPWRTGLGQECIPSAIPWIPFWFTPLASITTIPFYIFGTLIWFTIGSLIGAIITHIKSRRQS